MVYKDDNNNCDRCNNDVPHIYRVVWYTPEGVSIRAVDIQRVVEVACIRDEVAAADDVPAVAAADALVVRADGKPEVLAAAPVVDVVAAVVDAAVAVVSVSDGVAVDEQVASADAGVGASVAPGVVAALPLVAVPGPNRINRESS